MELLSGWLFCNFCALLQEVETKAKNMEEEVYRLRKSLEEKNGQLQATASTADKVIKK